MRSLFIGAAFAAVCTSNAAAQSCSYSVSNVAFSTVNLLSGNEINATATIQANCTNTLTLGLSARICFNIGTGAGGSSGNVRTMANGSNLLQYQLYQDAGRTVPWGHVNNTALGQPATMDITLLPLSSASFTKTIYAKILGNQQTRLGGSYTSLFSGGAARFNVASYITPVPACTAVTGNAVNPTFSVSAFVDRTCNVSAQDLNFGSRGVLSTNTDAASQLSVNCTTGLPYAVGLSGGTGNLPPTARRMTRTGGQYITYGLYQDAARSTAWGSATGATLGGTGSGVAQTINVYGRVPPQTTPSPGVYSDTVAVTVTY